MQGFGEFFQEKLQWFCRSKTGQSAYLKKLKPMKRDQQSIHSRIGELFSVFQKMFQ
jgi:hypothetical protein